MGKLAVAAVALFILSGCASNGGGYWHKPGATEQDFYQARAQCSSMSGPTPQIAYSGQQSGSFGAGYNQTSAMLGAARQRQIYADCMRGQGWQQMDDSRWKTSN